LDEEEEKKPNDREGRKQTTVPFYILRIRELMEQRMSLKAPER